MCETEIGTDTDQRFHVTTVKQSRLLVLIAIIFVSLNLRAALTAPAAIFDQIKASFPISDTARGSRVIIMTTADSNDEDWVSGTLQGE